MRTGTVWLTCSVRKVQGRPRVLASKRTWTVRSSTVPDAAFARRGLGFGASQGLSTDENDGTASFALPPHLVALEGAAGRGAAHLHVAGPNPFAAGTTVALTVDRTQSVRVELVDLLGRRVAVLHDGPVAAGVPLSVAVRADGLPSGVYVVRAAGETFALAARVTVVR